MDEACEEKVAQTMENIRRCSPLQLAQLLDETAAQLETYGMTLQAEINRRASALIRPPIVTDEVVERVADALFRVFEEREPPTEYPLQGQWVTAARAAIAAMPTIDQDGGEA